MLRTSEDRVLSLIVLVLLLLADCAKASNGQADSGATLVGALVLAPPA